ncbi:hypothetical protein D9M69_442440 [compost metagenome]
MAVIDRMVATVSPGDLRFLLGRNRADHVQAEQLGPLRNDQTDTASGGMQQDAVARFEVVDAAHQVRGRQATHGHRGSGLEADGFRQLDQRRGRDQALGAVSAEGVEETGIGDAITDLDVGDPFTNGLDYARGLDAHAVGHRNRVGTVTEIGVGIVQANRHMTKANLAGTGLADFDVLIT